MKLVLAVFAAVLTVALPTHAAAPLPDELSGQGLTLRFENKSATPSGTLQFKDQSYPFTAEF